MFDTLSEKHPFMEQIRATDEESLLVNFIGIMEKGMWPAKEAVKTEGGPTMELFERLDRWLEDKFAGTVDALLMGCVGGVSRI